jgi:hypothetical protein
MGFVSSLFGANNDYNATGAQNLANTNYSGALASALASAGGANSPQSNQQRLAQMLMQQAQGNGPSVAQNQLNQTTNANNQAAAGMLGSTRGINPALAARMILQNNAANNQNAAGQAATLRAQEQLGAAGQLGNALGTQRGQDISTVGTIGGLQNTQNANQIQNALGTQQINAGISGQNATTNGSIVGGILGGGASAIAGMASGGGGKWRGGAIGYADGGEVTDQEKVADTNQVTGIAMPQAPVEASPISAPPIAPTTAATPPPAYAPMFTVGNTASIPGLMGSATSFAGENPGAGIAGGLTAGARAAGSLISKYGMAAAAAHGGPVPGKASVQGDSPTNDTVPTMLSPGEVVLPRSVTGAKNSPEKAKEFMEALKKQREPKDDEGYGKVLRAQRMLHERLAAVEKYCMGGKVKNA